MIEGYLTIKDIAKKWKVTPRRVQILCSEGKIEGATRFGYEWAIPADAKRPADGRVTSGEYRNWRKK
ncbi:DNA-binding protein [Butyrivibrio sp. X503]|uniref:DNA-binding protein n=1 Tax=Butyrivibrio sp. X503 TaxID=2364878 RepID=UPI000EAACA68|nr:DNA-binding protein [Butyrivibrio sp. X503]RKM55457.1 DNA-binding protein [Butyrivibrio sp. X503]